MSGERETSSEDVAQATEDADSTGREQQEGLFGADMPCVAWDADVARHALDELFTLARQYTSTEAYRDLLAFIARFRFYSPFNAMLIHVQLPGATYVAPPNRWLSEYRRRIKADARPIVILRPMGPVMFVFDVSDTEAIDKHSCVPREVETPFEVRGGSVGQGLPRTIENACRDGVQVLERQAGSQSAGLIRRLPESDLRTVEFTVKTQPARETVRVPLRYELLLNSGHSPETQYAALCHELAHLYCGHLGTPNPQWWPDRRGLAEAVREFEAESVCYLVCRRLGIDSRSDAYLADYYHSNSEVPSISFECVMRAAGLIEQMRDGRLEPRQQSKRGSTSRG